MLKNEGPHGFYFKLVSHMQEALLADEDIIEVTLCRRAGGQFVAPEQRLGERCIVDSCMKLERF